MWNIITNIARRLLICFVNGSSKILCILLNCLFAVHFSLRAVRLNHMSAVGFQCLLVCISMGAETNMFALYVCPSFHLSNLSTSATGMFSTKSFRSSLKSIQSAVYE